MRRSTIISTAALFALAAFSRATTLDFETHADDFGNPMFEQGFKLTTATSGWAIVSNAWTFSPPVTQNGTVRFLMSGNGNGGVNGAQMTLTDTTNVPFSIQSFDSAVMFLGTANTVDVIGNINGGGTVNASFNINSTFTTFNLSGAWTNLDSVIFRSGTNAAFVTDPGVSLDNIVVNSPVPEPATLAVLGLGVAFLKRRRK